MNSPNFFTIKLTKIYLSSISKILFLVKKETILIKILCKVYANFSQNQLKVQYNNFKIN